MALEPVSIGALPAAVGRPTVTGGTTVVPKTTRRKPRPPHPLDGSTWLGQRVSSR